jgi:predicted nuclease of predicted toxin-antitoxin system
MLRLLADEDFDDDIIRGVLRRLSDLDLVRVQELGLAGSADPVVLERAAQEDRIVLTHDVNTMVAAAFGAWAGSCQCPASSLSANPCRPATQ